MSDGSFDGDGGMNVCVSCIVCVLVLLPVLILFWRLPFPEGYFIQSHSFSVLETSLHFTFASLVKQTTMSV